MKCVNILTHNEINIATSNQSISISGLNGQIPDNEKIHLKPH